MFEQIATLPTEEQKKHRRRYCQQLGGRLRAGGRPDGGRGEGVI
jgi:hypothetical protein